MLHIIFLILKILGIILLIAVTAIVVLLTALILLPVKYSAAASWDKNTDSIRWRIKFHWLIRLISGEAIYENGAFSWRFRTAWKRFNSSGESGASKKDTGRKKSPSLSKDKKNNTDPTSADHRRAPAAPRDNVGTESARHFPSVSEKEEKKQEEETPFLKEKYPKRKTKKKSLHEKFSSCLEKIKYTFQKIYDTINMLTKKKDRLCRFVTNEIHKKAFLRIAGELKRFLCFLRPKRLEGNLEFGFEDPAHTGYVLAGLSIIYPLIGEYTEIRADFEHKVLRGSVLAEGKFRLLYLIIPAWNLFFDKNIRATYRHIRNFKL